MKRDTSMIQQVGRIVERGKWLAANAPDTQILRISLLIWHAWAAFRDRSKLPSIDDLLQSDLMSTYDPADVIDAYLNVWSASCGLDLYQRAVDHAREVVISHARTYD